MTSRENQKIDIKKQKSLECSLRNHKSSYFKHIAEKEFRSHSKNDIDKYTHSQLNNL